MFIVGTCGRGDFLTMSCLASVIACEAQEITWDHSAPWPDDPYASAVDEISAVRRREGSQRVGSAGALGRRT